MQCIFTILQQKNIIFLQVKFNKCILNSDICEELENRDRDRVEILPIFARKQKKFYLNKKKGILKLYLMNH